MRVLMDVDGVVCNYTRRFLDCATLITGKTYAEDQVTDWELRDVLQLTEAQEKAALLELAVRLDFDEYPGAVEGIKLLQDDDHEVVFVTADHRDVLDWGRQRDKWLKARFPFLPVVHTKDKWVVSGACLIDDKPDNVERWLIRNRPGFGVVWAQPWNYASHRLDRRMCRTSDWNVVRKLLSYSINESDAIAETRSP